MKYIDITQELFTGKVYPGDPVPSYERCAKISEGDSYNLTRFSMGAHNATHIDAPYHFYEDGKTIDQLDLNRLMGPCTVINWEGNVKNLRSDLEHSQKRILIKGNGVITLEVAKILNEYQVVLVGVESQSVGPLEAPMPVHLELLAKEVILLEGIILNEVPEGDYFLFTAPLKLGGFDGAPCRAILVYDEEL